MITNSNYLEQAILFLISIRIPVVMEKGAKGFLPHVRIQNGHLHVDPTCPVDDLLHEAGHLATTPSRWRHLCNDDVSIAHQQMFADIHAEQTEPDGPLYRAAIQAGEAEAIAWGWAAGIHLGFPHDVIISNRPEIYEGKSEDVRFAHSVNCALGIHGLAHAGFCSTNGLGNKPKYPKLAFWTQELS
jgi:hypothetical protein